jgi:hypothetical protein
MLGDVLSLSQTLLLIRNSTWNNSYFTVIHVQTGSQDRVILFVQTTIITIREMDFSLPCLHCSNLVNCRMPPCVYHISDKYLAHIFYTLKSEHITRSVSYQVLQFLSTNSTVLFSCNVEVDWKFKLLMATNGHIHYGSKPSCA